MRSIRTRDTRPELALRRALRASRVHYRSQYQTRSGRIDIALPGSRVAVFVDGAFWHGTSWRLRGFDSLESQFDRWRNGDWWLAKIRGNVARDRRQGRELRNAGWLVVRFSDYEIEMSTDRCVRRITRLVALRETRV
jgi:DNA mismatch endonuclease (patch repair protein)